MPLSVEDLSVEVQILCADFISALPCIGHDPLVVQDAPQGTHVPGRLVAVVAVGLAAKNPKEIIIRSCDDFTKRVWVKENKCKKLYSIL